MLPRHHRQTQPNLRCPFGQQARRFFAKIILSRARLSQSREEGCDCVASIGYCGIVEPFIGFFRREELGFPCQIREAGSNRPYSTTRACPSLRMRPGAHAKRSMRGAFVIHWRVLYPCTYSNSSEDRNATSADPAWLASILVTAMVAKAHNIGAGCRLRTTFKTFHIKPEVPSDNLPTWRIHHQVFASRCLSLTSTQT